MKCPRCGYEFSHVCSNCGGTDWEQFSTDYPSPRSVTVCRRCGKVDVMEMPVREVENAENVE